MTRLRSLTPILPVRSVPRSITFYRSLGFNAEHYADGKDYAFLTRDNLEMHLRHAPDLEQDQNPSGVYFLLNHGTAAGLQAEFQAGGVPILSALALRDWGMREFMVSDPDGNLLRFGESVTAPAPAR